MSLSDNIQYIINSALPLTVRCGSCDRDIDLSELLYHPKREWNRLIADILQAVVDEIQK